MSVLPALGPMLTALPMTAVDREHLRLLNAHRFRRETVVNSLQDGLWDPKRQIAPLVAWVAIPDDEHIRFVLEDLADLVRAKVPHLRNLSDRIVTLGECDVFLLC
jgi:hypothetical protein